MAYKDLREFIADLEQRGLLKRIRAEVDPELEITEITDRISKRKGKENVALLFENVKGSRMPVLMNAFGSYERMALGLGVEKLDDIADELREMLKLPYLSLQNKMNVVTLIPTIKKAINFPKYVKNAPCQEVVETENPSLDEIPILKCWPHDGGPFVTLPLVFTKNPKTGKRNVGMYRLQKYDSKTTGMHWHIHKNGAENFRDTKALGGEKIECAVAIGTDPAVTYAATAPLPRDVDEMVFAGFLRHKPVEMVKCKTVDIEVPAHAEIILEQPPMDTMVIATPWPEKHAFYYNQKINCMRASGWVKFNGKKYEFDPKTDFGTLDWGRGVWTYDNTWFWGSGNADVDGNSFGWNIGYGFGDTSAASENILFWNGKAILDDGTEVNIKDVMCFAEKVHNKY